jgi:hypothetical protein
MKMRHIILGATALVFAASMASAFGPDVRDPGRLPKPDRPEVSKPSPTVQAAGQKDSTASAEQDVRDPGHSTPPDKLRDGVRRR